MGDVVRLCFVCLGNICRSPTAAAVMRHRAARAGLADRIRVESAGTSDWHIGEPPDARAAAEARRRGVPMEDAARRFTAADLARFDLVLAMDSRNLRDLRALAREPEERARIRLLREFAEGAREDDLDVPDPYFGGDGGFAEVFELIEDACAGLIAHLRAGPLADAG